MQRVCGTGRNGLSSAGESRGMVWVSYLERACNALVSRVGRVARLSLSDLTHFRSAFRAVSCPIRRDSS
jgi:hypothetical protein